MDDLTREFLIESQEGLDRMERCLTELESRPEEAELLGEIFRAVHTIKGTTGFLGFKRLEKLAHAGENLLGLLRDRKLIADRAIISGLLTLLDELRAILSLIEAEGNEGDGVDAALIERLEALQVPAAARARTEAVGGHESTQASVAVAVETAPVVPEIVAPAIPDSVVHGADVVPPSATPIASPPAAAPQETPAQSSNARQAAAGSAAESTLRVDVALLNRMMNLVGELVLTRNQVLQAAGAHPRLTQLSRRLDMVTADLREAVMKARMQPVSIIFSKMPRVVRDISQALGKRVSVEMQGQDTELDKSLLEAIKDPLTHAVRNSLDHGIETPEARAASGKDAEGTLKLRAVQEGSHVLIEISDDGAGVPVEKVRKKAIERGLISAERAAHMPDRELLQMIFMPGFSTAAAVTNVSGRGVGMDVVRTNVEKIGGTVEMDSRLGQGATLRMRIPLTLAIVPALIVKSMGQSFALPRAALSELVHIPGGQAARAVEWIEDVPLYRLRGNLLPLVFLDRLLRLGEPRPADHTQDLFIAVLDADGRSFGLVVDGLADPEEIVVKPLSPVLKEIGIYSGATVLGNADLALILDASAIAARSGVTLARTEQTKEEDAVEHDAEAAKQIDYLVVGVAGRQAAVPLSDVLRIEQLSAQRVEYIGTRAVLNFEGHLLPLEDPAALIEAARANPEAELIVVVCRHGERQVGVMVSEVLDVASGADLIEAGTTQLASGVTLLKEKVTSIVDVAAVAPLAQMDAASWQ